MEDEAVVETEGVATETQEVAESPAAEVSGNVPPENMPYSRFKEKNDEARTLREENEALQRQIIEAQTAAQSPQKRDYGFDEDTVGGVQSIAKDTFKPIEDKVARLENEVQAYKAMEAIKKEVPDWDELQDDVVKEFGDLQRANFSGPKMAKFLALAVKAKSGKFTAEGRKAEQKHQDMRAAAAPPGGSARPAKEKEKSLAEMTIEERDAIRAANVRNASLYPD